MEALIASVIVAIIGVVANSISDSNDREWQSYQQDKNNEFNALQAKIQREFYSEPSQFERLTTELGFNPNIAASAVSGRNAVATSGAQSATPVGQILGDTALANLFGGMSDKLMHGALQEAQIHQMNSESRLLDMQAMYVPISHEETKRLNNALIDKYKSEGNYHEAMAGYYDEMSDWVVPLSQAEAIERLSHAQNLIVELGLISEKINTEQSMQDLYASEEAVNRSEVSVNNALTDLYKEQKLTQEHLTNKEYYNERRAMYEQTLSAMDFNLRNGIGQLPLPESAKEYLVLAAAYGDDDAKSVALDMVRHEIALGRAMFDAEVEQTFQNWWKIVANNMTKIPNSIAEGVGFGMGMRTGQLGVGKAGKPGKAGKAGKAGAKPNQRTTDANGNVIRVDSHGTTWVNGVPQ